MNARYLTCRACRIRVRGNALEIGVLEGCCPLCQAKLTPVSSAADVMGFRSFDLKGLSELDSEPAPRSAAGAAGAVLPCETVAARDGADDDRWSDDGGSVAVQAVAKWLGAH